MAFSTPALKTPVFSMFLVAQGCFMLPVALCAFCGQFQFVSF